MQKKTTPRVIIIIKKVIFIKNATICLKKFLTLEKFYYICTLNKYNTISELNQLNNT